MMSSELVKRARDFAEKKHDGQFRRDGTPYFTHLARVADIVFKFKESSRIDEIVSAAFLHDTLEDTDTGVDELRQEFGETVALLVVELTTDKLRSEVIGKANYLSNKFSCERSISNWALVIKLSDRLDNVSDLDKSSIESARKKKTETLTILDTLEEKRELTGAHKKLILAIRDKMEEFDI